MAAYQLGKFEEIVDDGIRKDSKVYHSLVAQLFNLVRESMFDFASQEERDNAGNLVYFSHDEVNEKFQRLLRRAAENEAFWSLYTPTSMTGRLIEAALSSVDYWQISDKWLSEFGNQELAEMSKEVHAEIDRKNFPW